MTNADPTSLIGRALVLHPVRKGDGLDRAPTARLAEAIGLAEAIALDVVDAEAVTLARPRPSTLFGGGTVQAQAGAIAALEIDVVIVDAALSPVQQRNLERAWDCKVIDRTGLILEIFGARARTREGQLQVELAALSYQRSRLVRSWTHLERQRGALGFVGGPGESQLEIDRRLIDERIAKLKRQLGQVRRTRALHRAARRRVPYPVVAIVGYTNAGKSTLFNALTRAGVRVQDQVFATLDPTMRGLSLPSGQRVILSDTVGFISDLPTDLVAAFRATLEEVVAADVIVHVRDISHPDTAAQKNDVEAVLEGLEAPLDGRIEVLNKIDRLTPDARLEIDQRAAGDPRIVAVSALTRAGCDDLLHTIDAQLLADRACASLRVPLCDGASLAWLYRRGEVLERHDDDTFASLEVRLTEADLARFTRRPGVVVP